MPRTNKVYEGNERNSSKCSYKFSYIFASRLKEAREYRKLTQEEVADKLEISARTYQHYESLSESNIRVPNFEIVNELSKILDCDITYLTRENKDNEFKKDTQHASEITGLKYETIEILEKIKNSKKPDNENHLHKCILFVLDFLLQRIAGRWILWNMFQFFFKEYHFTRENNNGGSNVVELEADSIVPERNVALFVDDISEGVFFSNITNEITKIKVIEKTTDFDTNACDYLPTEEDILDEIKRIERDISLYKEKEYKKYNPYTPKYALEYQHWEDTNKWESRDNLAERIESRVRLDLLRENTIEELERTKENCILKLQKLYSKN